MVFSKFLVGHFGCSRSLVCFGLLISCIDGHFGPCKKKSHAFAPLANKEQTFGETGKRKKENRKTGVKKQINAEKIRSLSIKKEKNYKMAEYTQCIPTYFTATDGFCQEAIKAADFPFCFSFFLFPIVCPVPTGEQLFANRERFLSKISLFLKSFLPISGLNLPYSCRFYIFSLGFLFNA